MGFIKQALPIEAYDELVPDGVHRLRIVGYRDLVSSAGNQMTQVQIRVERKEAVLLHYLLHPTDDSPAHENERRGLQIKRFLVCFDVEFTSAGFDTEDLYGATAICRVTQEKGKDGIIRNRVQIPRLTPVAADHGRDDD